VDQTVEAVIATMIFLAFLAATNYISLGIFSSLAAWETDATYGDMASVISSFVVLQNNASASLWNEWVPTTDPGVYGLPSGIHIEVNATSFVIQEGGEIVTLWSRTTGISPPPQKGEYDRLVRLDDGSVVLLIVVVW